MESIGHSGKVGGPGALRSLLGQCLSSSHLHCQEPKDVEEAPWFLARISSHCCCDWDIVVRVEVQVEVGSGSCSRNLSFHGLLVVGRSMNGHIGDSLTSPTTTNADAVMDSQGWLE